MMLGLAKIIDCPGGSVPFETSVDFSDLQEVLVIKQLKQQKDGEGAEE